MPTKKTSKKERLVLLDAHAILHRAYHALPDFTSQSGEPTGALYGVVAMLMKIIPELKPDYIVACYDLPEPTFRHGVYEEYKSGRAEIEDALVHQLNRSRDVFEAFNIPIYEKAGYEADDILGTIVEQTKKNKDLEIIIASGDMDTLQLVEEDRVYVYTLRKGIQDTVLYDEQAVVDRFGFGSDLIPDFKGLRGDPSDNIIGIPGIGEKTATTLITTFGTIEDIYKKLKKDTEVFEKAGVKPRIIKLLEEHEEDALFSKMLAEIRRDTPITFSLPKESWRDGLDPDKALKLFDDLSFRTLRDRFRSMFADTGNEEASVGEEGDDKPDDEKIDSKELKETAVALWLLRSDITNPELEDVLRFAKTDSFQVAHKRIFTQLKEEGLDKVYEKIEKPLIPITDEMKVVGIKVDVAYLEELSKEYHKELTKIEKRIYTHAGGEFNINSPKQLGEVLFETLGLSIKNHKKTSGGQKSTRESELEKMRELHPIIEDILAYREIQKLLSTYIDNIPKMVGKDGRLHAEFLQTGTTTGRMASQNPNLQNIPIKTELGRRIRNAFVAEKDFVLLACDYSQIELRVAAFLSGDEKLTRIFAEGGDVHTAVAAEVFGVPPEQVDYELRRRAKVINFGIIYGMGVNALRQSLGKDTTTLAEARQFYNDYFTRFSTLAHYLDRVKAHAARTGHTETYFGRKRYFEGITSSVPFVRASAERMAINAPIQGTEADIVKLATIRIHEYLNEHDMLDDVRLILNVHDELVYEVRKDVLDTIAPEIKRLMETIVPKEESRGIVFTVDMAAGKNWGQLKKYDAQV
ncbi:MAG: DNA polymerase [Candidatus Pacebacteria bacterium]|nr:DNA polymerase [Candidatus Paceibacterota bacterium]